MHASSLLHLAHEEVERKGQGKPLIGVAIMQVTCFCRWMRRLKKEGRMWRSPPPNR